MLAHGLQYVSVRIVEGTSRCSDDASRSSSGNQLYMPGGGAYEHFASGYDLWQSTDSRNQLHFWRSRYLGCSSRYWRGIIHGFSPHQTVRAFAFAKGWKRRLGAVGQSRVVLTTGGKSTVVRTVCSDRLPVSKLLINLSIPSLNEYRYWRQAADGTGFMRKRLLLRGLTAKPNSCVFYAGEGCPRRVPRAAVYNEAMVLCHCDE
jgi:hypothetical protein